MHFMTDCSRTPSPNITSTATRSRRSQYKSSRCHDSRSNVSLMFVMRTQIEKLK